MQFSQIEKTKTDIEYRNKLAKAIGVKVEKLSPIVGPEEFKYLLSQYKEDHFYTGESLSEGFEERFRNVKSKNFRLNLHMHTTASDGRFELEELLDMSVQYANQVAKTVNDNLPPFVMAITNHDSLDDTVKAIKIISASPEKFKNLKFIPALEFSVRLDNPEIFTRPIPADLLGYCIDPFDSRLNGFLKNLTGSRFEEARKVLKGLEKTGIYQDWEEIKNSHPLVKIGGSMGFFDFIWQFLEKKYKLHDEELKKTVRRKQCPFSPAIKEVHEVLRDSYGYLGLAHPVRIHLFTADEKKFHNGKYSKVFQNILYAILQDAYQQGAVAIEGNYNYVQKHLDNEFYDRLQVVQDFCSEFKVLKTGGTDCHRKNIFTHHEDLSPEEIESLLS